MNEPRDTIVGDALRRLDVPDHAPDFWSRLESRLADGEANGDEPAHDRDEEMTVVDLQSSPAARRAANRSRTPMLALAAAVAVVVALVVGVAALDGGGDDESQLDVAETPGDVDPDPDVAPPSPDVDDTTDTTDTTSPPVTSTTVVSGEDLAVEAEETAAAWIDALSSGDMAQAHELFDEQTRAGLDRSELEELSTELAEGAAAFAADGIARDVTAVEAAAGVFHVVTFTGEVEREGMVETASYPVVVTGTGVHLALDGPQLELDPEYVRSQGTTLAPPLEVLVSDTADTWMWVDGDDPERFLSPGRLVLGAEALGGAGTHVVSLVAIDGGRITARAYTVVVP